MTDRTLLFGMTGFGNDAFKALRHNEAVTLVGVLTPPRQKGPFPYYPCEQLHAVVSRSDVPLYEGYALRDQGTQSLIRSLSPDLIVVATFNQIVPSAIIAIPRRGIINIHPSLLPKFRGSIPTVCALLKGESRTGVTAHFIEDERIDRGRIIAQTAVDIEPADTDGMLRKKLSSLLDEMVTVAIARVQSQEPASFPEQEEADATYCPKRSSISNHIDITKPFPVIVNTIRALTPYPGAYVTSDGVRYLVNGAVLAGPAATHPKRQSCSDVIEVNTPEGLVEFTIQKAS